MGAFGEEAVKALFTSDLHLTNQPRDEYRWQLFPWLKVKARKHKVDFVGILGDLTDRKDCHPATLVNRVVEELKSLSEVCPVEIVMGNHDYDVDGDCPFFRFLNDIPGLRFYYQPVRRGRVLFFPHTRNFIEDWDKKLLRGVDLVLIHQTLSGAVAENGFRLDGIDPGEFVALSQVFGKRGPEVFSGDVHVPQRVGPVVYVGAPYHVHFGDRFKSRVVLWQSGHKRSNKIRNLRFHAPRRLKLDVSNLDQLNSLVWPGDQVNVTVHAHPRDWQKMRLKVKERCDELRAELNNCSLARQSRVRIQDDDQESASDRVVIRSPGYWVEQVGRRNRVEDDVIETGVVLATEG